MAENGTRRSKMPAYELKSAQAEAPSFALGHPTSELAVKVRANAAK